MQGKAQDIIRVTVVPRITPAYAGKRAASRSGFETIRDHPRVCGEKVVPLVWMTCDIGSPPHMRGKANASSHGFCGQRITPAYAGKSCANTAQQFCAWDHPRICGEKSSPARQPVGGGGSPPRMRGKVQSLRENIQRMGITPAYAGKRAQVQSQRTAHRDHPRVCGEKYKGVQQVSCILGSPPRMRGKGGAMCSTHLSKGITPAYAGKSSPPRW